MTKVRLSVCEHIPDGAHTTTHHHLPPPPTAVWGDCGVCGNMETTTSRQKITPVDKNTLKQTKCNSSVDG